MGKIFETDLFGIVPGISEANTMNLRFLPGSVLRVITLVSPNREVGNREVEK